MKKSNYILSFIVLTLIFSSSILLISCDDAPRNNPDDPKASNYVPTYVWRDALGLNTARGVLSTAVYNNKIYAFGGYVTGGSSYSNSIEVYNPSTNTWTPLATTLVQGTYYHTTVTINNKIVLIGGTDSANNRNFVQEYDPEGDSWTTKNEPEFAPRQQHSSVVVGNKVYVLGGFNGSNLDSLQSYTPADGISAGTWENLKVMPYVNRDFAAVPYGDNIYVFGGTINGVSGFNRVAMYSVSENNWYNDTNNGGTLAPMPTNRFVHSAAIVGDKVYLFGGKNNSGNVSVVDIYCIGSNSWSQGSNFSALRTDLSVATIKSKMYTIGGVSSGTPSNIVKVYTPYYD